MTTNSWPRFGAFSFDFKRGELDRMIDAFRRTGLTAVQLAGELLQEVVEEPGKAVAMKSKLAAGGIGVVALAGYRNLISPDTAKRAANLTFLKRCLEIAPQLGTTVVATETGTRSVESDWVTSAENASPAAWDCFHDALDQLLPVAERHGSVLALEGYVNNVLATSDQMVATLKRYPSKHLGVVLDPYNYLARDLLPRKEQVTREFLARFEGRFVLAHLKDVAAGGAEVNTPEFGTGVFPQKMYLEFLRDRRPGLSLILEHLPFDHVPDAIRLAKNLAG